MQSNSVHAASVENQTPHYNSSKSEFVSLPQASREHPEISTAFFRKLVWQRKLPFYKFGSRVMFKRSELDAYFESRRIPAAAEAV